MSRPFQTTKPWWGRWGWESSQEKYLGKKYCNVSQLAPSLLILCSCYNLLMVLRCTYKGQGHGTSLGNPWRCLQLTFWKTRSLNIYSPVTNKTKQIHYAHVLMITSMSMHRKCCLNTIKSCGRANKTNRKRRGRFVQIQGHESLISLEWIWYSCYEFEILKPVTSPHLWYTPFTNMKTWHTYLH